LSETRVAPGRLRIALALDTPGGTPLDAACKRATLEAAKLCESLGHRVEERKLPVDNAVLGELRLTVINVNIARALADAAKTLGRAVGENDVEPVTWEMNQAGKRTDAVAYARALAAMHQTGLAMARFQETYDVILSPTLAKPPVPLGVLSLSPQDRQAFLREIVEFSPYTGLYNVTGQPSMSVPLGWTEDGLPLGVMFSARFGDEATLFRLAAQLEKAKPWADRKPTV
jgi:amidase/6-aminohexanoate-cyclic-dimer hydrolase